MLENILGGLLRQKDTDDCEKEEGGLGKYLIAIVVIFVLLGGLKLFIKPKEEEC